MNAIVNRKAYHDYDILDTLEVGLVLTGTEIKSIRAGRVDLRGAYARPQGGELWLCEAHIAPYPQARPHNHEPRRPRKLLLHRKELDELTGQVSRKGLTLVPLRLYIKGHVAKVQLALVRGRRLYDKRRAIKERDMDREARAATRRRR
ncbi:MAG: SsrA-binding protein SmpB [Dehalococcoidia bacterium]